MLEERRELLRTSWFQKDEGALFTIANEFAIRHQRATSTATTTRRSWTGCSGGTWPPSSSPTGSSTRQRPADAPVDRPRARTHRRVAAGRPPRALPAELPLTEDEAGYVAAARAPNTLRGYRSRLGRVHHLVHRTHGSTRCPRPPRPSAAYLTELARAGAKVGTMSRRLSAIRFAHQLRDLPDPTTGARVVAVWEGIRRTHGAPPDQAAPLMPPELFDVLDACPTTRTWRTRGRPPEPDLAGLRDRALLLVGFFAALRRSELAGLTVDQITEHPHGLVLALPRSKTNQDGTRGRAGRAAPRRQPRRCPVIALQAWLEQPASPTARCCARSARATGRSPGRSTPSRSTTSSRPPSPAPGSTRPLQRALPARRVRHLRPPARRLRPGHRPPDPPPLPGHRRHLRPHPRGLGRQRRHPARALTILASC